MLLIRCPYCGERPEIEFSYGGQAHLARPGRPAELSDDEWAAYLYLRDNPRGRHAERWRLLLDSARIAEHKIGFAHPAEQFCVSARITQPHAAHVA